VGGVFDATVVEAWTGRAVVPRVVCVFYYNNSQLPGEAVAVLHPKTSGFEVVLPYRVRHPDWVWPRSWDVYDPYTHYGILFLAEGHTPGFVGDTSNSLTETLQRDQDVLFLDPQAAKGNRGRLRAVLFRKDVGYTEAQDRASAAGKMDWYLPLIKACLDSKGTGVSVEEKLWVYSQIEESILRVPYPYEPALAMVRECKKELIAQSGPSSQPNAP